MKLAWTFCILLVGTLATATPGEERAAAEANLGSGYMMAFPMNDDQLAEESAMEQAKTLMAPEGSQDDGDDDEDDDATPDLSSDQDGKQALLVVEVEDDKKGDDSSDDPAGILQAQLEAEEEEKSRSLPEPIFKRPKIEELRKILGFPPLGGAPPKTKPVPQEKPKVFQQGFSKSKPKSEPSPLGGLQFSLPLRREDGMKPFGFPKFPLRRQDSLIRPFGLPDIMHAASSILRRAIMDDNDAQDISKDDKDDNDMMNEGDTDEDEEDEDEDDDNDEPLMIVPIPEDKEIPEVPQQQQPLFRRFPLPIPIPFPRPVARPRLPFPPLTPVAFFLPLAQQLMQNIMTKPVITPRSHPPMFPLSPIHPIIPVHHPVQNIIPIQTQFPIVPVHPPVQHFIPLQQPGAHAVPSQTPMPHFVPVHSPIIPLPQQAIHIPFFTPIPPQMPRPLNRPMPRRIPVPPPPPMARRMPIPSPLLRMHAPPPPHSMAPLIRRPVAMSNTRPLPRMVRPPMPPVHPIFFMMHVPVQVPIVDQQQLQQQQQHIPIFHPQSHQQQMQAMQPSQPRMVVPDDERVIFVRPNMIEEDPDEEQSEIVLLYPAEDAEYVQRPPVVPRPLMRPPSPAPNPLQRFRLLRDLLLARQANRQAMNPMSPQGRASRIVEIVQQQLRIIPAAHHGQQVQTHPNRADASELHPVYVPYPGPQ